MKQQTKKSVILISVSILLLLSTFAGTMGVRYWADHKEPPAVTEQRTEAGQGIVIPPIAAPSQGEGATDTAELSFDIGSHKPSLDPDVDKVTVEYATKEVVSNAP